MATLTIVGTTAKATKHTFQAVTQFRLDCHRFTPADSVALQTRDAVSHLRFTKLTVKLGSKTIFQGMVDLQQTTFDETGQYTLLEGRSDTAKLLDNEAPPMQYTQFSTLDLLKKHGYPYGITGHRLQKNCTFQNITVTKGMSHWEFICYFCKRAYGKTPFLDAAGKLTLSPFATRTHRFDNQGGTPFTKAILTEDRYELLSTLYVKTGADEGGTLYNHRVENGIAEAYGITRERYYHPTTIWEDDLKLSARHVVQEAMLDYRTLTVTSPMLLDLDVGDYASFAHATFSDHNWYVAGTTLLLDAGGVSTVATLWDRTILT